MAFPTYQPYMGYQPYYGQPVPDQLAQLRQNQFQQQPVIQPVQPMQTQPVSTVQQNGGINWVANKSEADSWPIAPGCAVALWDSNNPVVYLRQADSTGKPSTKVYDLVERDSQPVQIAPQIDLSSFVTRDELENILTERLKRPVGGRQKKEDE